MEEECGNYMNICAFGIFEEVSTIMHGTENLKNYTT
jgi:hypothetical protein